MPATGYEHEWEINEYTVLPVTDEMRNNGISSQGIALSMGIMPMDKKDELMKNSYAIFPNEPKQPDVKNPNMDMDVYYYIDGTLYNVSYNSVYRMKKLD